MQQDSDHASRNPHKSASDVQSTHKKDHWCVACPGAFWVKSPNGSFHEHEEPGIDAVYADRPARRSDDLILITAGQYERRFTVDSENYSHDGPQ